MSKSVRSRVKITPETTSGDAVPAAQLKRLGEAAGKAADSTGKQGDAAKKQADELEKSREQLAGATRTAIQSVSSGAIAALSQRGSGSQDAFYGAVRGAQAGAAGFGQAIGSTFAGPIGGMIGQGVGALAGAAIGRSDTALDGEARERAKAETRSIVGSAAIAGVPVDEERIGVIFKQAFLAAQRELRSEETVNRVSNGIPLS